MCELLGGWQPKLACPIKSCVTGRYKREDTLEVKMKTLERWVTSLQQDLCWYWPVPLQILTRSRGGYYSSIFIFFGILKATDYHHIQVRVWEIAREVERVTPFWKIQPETGSVCSGSHSACEFFWTRRCSVVNSKTCQFTRRSNSITSVSSWFFLNTAPSLSKWPWHEILYMFLVLPSELLDYSSVSLIHLLF